MTLDCYVMKISGMWRIVSMYDKTIQCHDDQEKENVIFLVNVNSKPLW